MGDRLGVLIRVSGSLLLRWGLGPSRERMSLRRDFSSSLRNVRFTRDVRRVRVLLPVSTTFVNLGKKGLNSCLLRETEDSVRLTKTVEFHRRSFSTYVFLSVSGIDLSRNIWGFLCGYGEITNRGTLIPMTEIERKRRGPRWDHDLPLIVDFLIHYDLTYTLGTVFSTRLCGVFQFPELHSISNDLWRRDIIENINFLLIYTPLFLLMWLLTRKFVS